jgi:nicotinate-nucleotide adenylyltransferase
LVTAESYRLTALFGGTFDPVHYGHIKTVQELKQRLNLDTVYMIPAAVPPLRDKPQVSASQRLQLLKLALEDIPGIFIDNRELKREGVSYSVDTLTEIRHELCDESALVMMIGGDAFLKLDQWHQWQRIFELAHVVVAHRPGWVLNNQSYTPALKDLIDQRLCDNSAQLMQQQSGCLWFERVTPVDISATMIRAAIEHNESIEEFVPSKVSSYIHDNRLYQ